MIMYIYEYTIIVPIVNGELKDTIDKKKYLVSGDFQNNNNL